jgi:hypothetical protein
MQVAIAGACAYVPCAASPLRGHRGAIRPWADPTLFSVTSPAGPCTEMQSTALLRRAKKDGGEREMEERGRCHGRGVYRIGVLAWVPVRDVPAEVGKAWATNASKICRRV